MTDISMWFTGEICQECKSRIYTDGYCRWCNKQCFMHGVKVRNIGGKK